MEVTFKTDAGSVNFPVKSTVELGRLLSRYSKTYGDKGFVASIGLSTMQSLGGFETIWGKAYIPRVNYAFRLKVQK
jgi:hypothetical protein